MPGKSFRHMSINHDDYIDSHTGRVQHSGGRGVGGAGISFFMMFSWTERISWGAVDVGPDPISATALPAVGP